MVPFENFDLSFLLCIICLVILAGLFMKAYLLMHWRDSMSRTIQLGIKRRLLLLKSAKIEWGRLVDQTDLFILLDFLENYISVI